MSLAPVSNIETASLQVENGRVINILENQQERYPLFCGNESSNYFSQNALKGVQDCTILARVFFSKENMQLIQDMIRYNVWLKSNKTMIIDEQSSIDLEIVARSTILQHGRFLDFKIKEQILELNNLILESIVPKIISEANQYVGYLERVSSLPIPIQHPANMSSRGSRLLRSVVSTF